MSDKQEQCLECLEQARLLGMGAERELKLMAERGVWSHSPSRPRPDRREAL